MRRLILTLLAFAAVARPVIIDEIAITVGNQAITQGEITRNIRLSALVSGEKPDESLESRRKAAGHLIEQALIRAEINFGSYPQVSPAEVDQSYVSTERTLGGSAALASILSQYLLTPDDLRSYLQWQLALLKFIGLRFRPAVQVTSEDVENYYKENVLARSGSTGKPASLNDLRDKIQEKLTGERVDRQVDDWIKRARSRTAIHYIDAALGTTQIPLDQSMTEPH